MRTQARLRDHDDRLATRLRVYPNLARNFTPTARNQLWAADITYIRLRTEFVYLAVVLDACSRRVIGWALGRTLEAELALAALRMALLERRPPPGWMHHSDRGVQYACGGYVATLLQHHAVISMSRKGNPYDNAACESFMKTLKYEEVYVTSTATCMRRVRLSASSWNRPMTKSGYIPLSAMCRRRNSSNREVVLIRPLHVLLHWGLCPQTPGICRLPARMSDPLGGDSSRLRAIPAAGSALGLRPRMAISSARVLPGWTTATSPCTNLSANGDYPLNFVSHSRGSLQFSRASPLHRTGVNLADL
ncbi:MAG: IS3 family transposase [Bryobacteraceae bacterium]